MRISATATLLLIKLGEANSIAAIKAADEHLLNFLRQNNDVMPDWETSAVGRDRFTQNNFQRR